MHADRSVCVHMRARSPIFVHPGARPSPAGHSGPLRHISPMSRLSGMHAHHPLCRRCRPHRRPRSRPHSPASPRGPCLRPPAPSRRRVGDNTMHAIVRVVPSPFFSSLPWPSPSPSRSHHPVIRHERTRARSLARPRPPYCRTIEHARSTPIPVARHALVHPPLLSHVRECVYTRRQRVYLCMCACSHASALPLPCHRTSARARRASKRAHPPHCSTC